MAEKAFVGQARCGFLLVSGHARVAGFCVLVATRSGHLSYTPESSVVAGSELVGEPPCECSDVLQGLFIKSSARTCQDRRSQLIKRSATRRHPTWPGSSSSHHPRHPKTRWHVRYRDGTTQRSRRHLSHQGRSAQRQTRGRTGRARRILRPTLTRPRSMLFGEYVTTIWWPNWDALAGPLQSAGAPIGGRHLVRCHLPGVLSRSSTLSPCDLVSSALGEAAEAIEECPRRQDRDRRVLQVGQITIPGDQRVSLRRNGQRRGSRRWDLA